MKLTSVAKIDQQLKAQGVRIYTRNPEITSYPRRNWSKVSSKPATVQIFPTPFKWFKDDSINAFATMGGFCLHPHRAD